MKARGGDFMKAGTVVRILSITLLTTLVSQGGEYLHPKFKAKELHLKTLYLMPPGVEIAKHGVRGQEGMGKEAEEASAAYAGAVAAGLTTAGFAAVSPFTEEALKGQTELKYAVADVQRKFDQLAPRLYKKKKDVRKGRFTLGDTVATLNSAGKADALVFIRAEGQKNTKGKGLMAGGLLGMALSGAVIYKSKVAVVDARTGDIVFFGDYFGRGIPKDDKFADSFRKMTSRK